jgi:hypothetical protein
MRILPEEQQRGQTAFAVHSSQPERSVALRETWVQRTPKARAPRPATPVSTGSN